MVAGCLEGQWRVTRTAAPTGGRLTSPSALAAAGIWPPAPGGAARPARTALAPPADSLIASLSPWTPSSCLLEKEGEDR